MGIDWRSMEGERLAGEILGRLLSKKPLDDLPLSRDNDGRLDLRGFVAPSPVVVGNLVGRWGKAKVLDGLFRFDKVTLTGLNLGKATATSLRMEGCQIHDCVFDGADLRDLRLWNVTTSDCSFDVADLRESLLGSWHRRRRNTWRNVSFRGSDLRATVIRGAAFEHCDFSRARIEKVTFEQCDIRDSRLGAKLRAVIFDGRKISDRPPPEPLRNVDFSEATFDDVDFWSCHIDNVTMPSDKGIFLVPGIRDIARRGLKRLEGDTSKDAHILRGVLEDRLEGPGDETGAGVFVRSDFEAVGGESLARLAERIYRGD